TNLSSDLKPKVFAVLVFGDPHRKYRKDNAWPINSPFVNSNPRDGSSSTHNVASFCNRGDEFCDPTGARLGPHLAYPSDGSIASILLPISPRREHDRSRGMIGAEA
ncbi:unnamed protein product, partial [Rhizoctonia solani]